LSLIAIAALASQANASVIFSFDERYGSVQPDKPAPWLTLKFDDVAPVAAGSRVKLSLATNGLTSPETVDRLYFNISTGFTASAISNFLLEAVTPLPVSSWSLTSDLNDEDAGGNPGKGFDFKLDLPNGAGSGSLQNPEVFELYISDLTGALSAQSFAAKTSDGLYAAAHIQSTGGNNGGSDWVAADSITPNPVINPVPEPGSMAALMGLLAGGAFLRSRRTPKA
jgi:hypothetical protein